MTCHNCQRMAKKFGKDRHGNQHYYCNQCKRTLSEPREKPLNNMRLPINKAVKIVSCFVEGNSVRSIERMEGVEKKTILSFLELVGKKCERIMDEKIRNVPVECVEVDEIWGYVLKKEKHKQPHELDNTRIGDAYTFVGIEAKTKLVVCFALGRRDAATAFEFMEKLYKATEGRFQLNTDGFKPYIQVVQKIFGADIDFAQLVKHYASDETKRERYSLGDFISAIKKAIIGNPDFDKISTSYVERQNLTMRMCMRRLTRLTNAFSKKWENLKAALALHFVYYNFCRVHQTLRVTPAMEAGIADHVWDLREVLTN